MDFRDLGYFEVIAELQHMGRAAARLHRTQPALTSAVRRLEEDCGEPLFERAGRGIRLTAAGEVMLKWARRTRLDVDDAKRELGDLGRGLVGTIRIGIVPTAAQFLLPPAARQLLSEAPQINLQTLVALIDVLKPLLRSGDLDMTIATEGASEPGFTSQFVGEDQVVVAASANHPLFDGTPTLNDLSNLRWVLQPPGAPTRDWLDQTFERRRLPRPRVQIESSMLIMLPPLIAETGLLSFISRQHLAGSGLREVAVKGTTMRRRLVVTYRQGRLFVASQQTTHSFTFAGQAPGRGELAARVSGSQLARMKNSSACERPPKETPANGSMLEQAIRTTTASPSAIMETIILTS